MTTDRARTFAICAGLAIVVATSCTSTIAGEKATPSTTSITARPSTGCSQPDAEFAQVGENGTLSSGGVDRVFSLEVPSSAQSNPPLPFVVNMHGAGGNRVVQERSSQFAELGRQRDFIVVEPDALAARNMIWDLSPSGPDVGFVDQLVDEVEARLCVDTSRVYLTGFSMGGMMSMVLACRDPERYAAIAPVAGVIAIEGCARETPIPVIAFHGTADNAVRFDGSLADNVAFVVPYTSGPSREEIVRTWAAKNGCAVPAEDAALPPDVDIETYDCPQNGSVEMYVVEDGGHTWPGSTPGPYSAALAGRTTQTVDATDLIWRFFEQHSRAG